jgi:hypothetical protein
MLTDRLRTSYANDEPEPGDRSMLVLQYAIAFVAVLAAVLLAVLN